MCIIEVTAARQEPETGFNGHDDGHSGSIKKIKLKNPNSYQRLTLDAAPCGYSLCLTSKPSAEKFTFFFLYLLF